MSSKWLLSFAYDSSTLRTILPTGLPQDNFDLLLTLPNQPKQALQDEIKKQLGLVAHRETRETDILALKVKNANSPGIHLGNGKDSNMMLGSFKYNLTNQRINLLAGFLESQFESIIIDRTGLTGQYDVALHWEPTLDPKTEKEEIKQALLDQLGLELVPTNMPIEMLGGRKGKIVVQFWRRVKIIIQMPDVDDIGLLCEYVDRNSESAFAEIVLRRVNLVFTVALRFTGNSEDAQDVTQAVFIILAKKAAGLRSKTILTGWLYETTRFTAMNFLTRENRRQTREQEAYMQSAIDQSEDKQLWQQIAPHLEEAMLRLRAADRELLAMRFYENKTGEEAAALLGIGVAAAHKRTNRAQEKLQRFFVSRGVTSTTAAIAGAVSVNSMSVAPVGLAKAISGVAVVKGAAASSSTLTLVKGALKIMAWTRIKTAVAVGTVALLAAGTAWQKYEIHRAGHGLVTLHVVNAPLDEVIRKIEHQSGQAIACDRRLHGPVTLTVNDMPLGQVLNQLILQTGAYWTVDYAVFDSNSALHKLETALQGEMELRNAGWTNLSCGPLGTEVTIRSMGYYHNGVFGTVVSGGGLDLPCRSHPDDGGSPIPVITP